MPSLFVLIIEIMFAPTLPPPEKINPTGDCFTILFICIINEYPIMVLFLLEVTFHNSAATARRAF